MSKLIFLLVFIFLLSGSLFAAGEVTQGSDGTTSNIIFGGDSNGTILYFPAGVTSGQVTTPDGCQTISCTTCPASQRFFVPIRTTPEWEAFRNNPPFDITFSACASYPGVWFYKENAGCHSLGCFRQATLVCSIGGVSSMDFTQCDPATRPTPDDKYVANSTCGTLGTISASSICSGTTVTGFSCNGNIYDVGTTISGLPYDGMQTVAGTSTSGTVPMTLYNSSGVPNSTMCAGAPTWEYSAWGACQADCTQTRTRTCVDSVTGNPTTGCTAGPWLSSQACTGGACVGCTYPPNAADVGVCNTACPGGPTKLCEAGSSNNSLINCPFGSTCYCQAGTTCSAYQWNVTHIPCAQVGSTCESTYRAVCQNTATSAAVNKTNCSGSPSGIPGDHAVGIPATPACSPSSTTDCYIKGITCPGGTGSCLTTP